MNKDEWKLARRGGIGGSDVAAILGLSPWKSGMDVWLEKKGLAEEKNDPDRDFLLDLGQQLEPVIARLYERQTESKLTLPFPMLWAHKSYPFLMGTPDRFVEGAARGVELKSESQFSDQFGDAGTDQVPWHYLLQCAHYMAVLDYDVWDVAVLHAGTRFGIYTLRRDRELEQTIIQQLCEWWERYIVKDTPPDVDSSGAWKVYLRKKFPANLLPVKEADAETLLLVELFRLARERAEFYGDTAEETENRLKLLIGEHEGLVGPFGKITWKKSKDSAVVDWETAFRAISEMIPADVASNALKACTTVRPGARRFLFKPKEGERHGRNIESATREAERIFDHAAPALRDGQHRLGSPGQSGH
jgi:putative phage-type endonuclease